MEVHQTEFLRVTNRRISCIVREEEGEGEIRVHLQHEAGEQMDIHPNRVKPTLRVKHLTCIPLDSLGSA